MSLCEACVLEGCPWAVGGLKSGLPRELKKGNTGQHNRTHTEAPRLSQRRTATVEARLLLLHPRRASRDARCAHTGLVWPSWVRGVSCQTHTYIYMYTRSIPAERIGSISHLALFPPSALAPPPTSPQRDMYHSVPKVRIGCMCLVYPHGPVFARQSGVENHHDRRNGKS